MTSAAVDPVSSHRAQVHPRPKKSPNPPCQLLPCLLPRLRPKSRRQSRLLNQLPQSHLRPLSNEKCQEYAHQQRLPKKLKWLQKQRRNRPRNKVRPKARRSPSPWLLSQNQLRLSKSANRQLQLLALRGKEAAHTRELPVRSVKQLLSSKSRSSSKKSCRFKYPCPYWLRSPSRKR